MTQAADIPKPCEAISVQSRAAACCIPLNNKNSVRPCPQYYTLCASLPSVHELIKFCIRAHRGSAAKGSHPLQGPLVSVRAPSHRQGQVQHEICALASCAQHPSPCCSSVQRTLVAVLWWAEVLSGDEVDDWQCCCQLPRPGILQAAVFVMPSAAQQSCQSATPL